MGSSPLDNYVSAVKSAEETLKHYMRMRDEAKRVGNYKTASKNHHSDGKVMNSYDWNIHNAKKNLKMAKERLAEAKKRYK